MITLDSKRLEEFGYRALLEHYHEAVPKIRRKTMTIPGMTGRWDFGSELDSKPFEIPIRTLSDSSLSLQRLQNELVAFLMDEFGNPRPLKMIFDYEPDKFYTVKVDDAIAPTLRSHILRYNTLPFIAHDPYKYANVTSDEVVWGSEIITFEWNYLLGHEGSAGSVSLNGPQTIDISVDGLAVQPNFEIEGTANSLKVECGDCSFSLPNFSNEKWEIDFKRYAVFRNGQETMIEIRDFYLMPGSNEIKVTGNNINIDLRIKFRDKYN